MVLQFYIHLLHMFYRVKRNLLLFITYNMPYFLYLFYTIYTACIKESEYEIYTIIR